MTTRAKGYIEVYRPQAATLELLEQVLAVLAAYRAYWPLTVRQVFYRLVAAYFYEKTEKAYDRLGNHIVNFRRARRVPFEAIRDDGIQVVGANDFFDIDHFWRTVRGAGLAYTRDKLIRQPLHLEVWCEAAGMVPQLATVARRYSVKTYSSSGFDSLTAKKELADRVCALGKPAVVLHLGDYDPSGVSIFDVIGEDVGEFLRVDRPGLDTRFGRVALTARQVDDFHLDTAPPKDTDSRSRNWTAETCQLEALAPDQIAQILEDAIVARLDQEQLAADRAEEAAERAEIAARLDEMEMAEEDDEDE